MKQLYRKNGFTLIELIIVILLIGIVGALAAPRFVSISSESKVEALTAIASQIEVVNKLIQSKAIIAGLEPAQQNPGGNQQSAFIIDFGFGETEVDWRNLCAEARAESGDALRFFDFIKISSDRLSTEITNRYAAVGYDIPEEGAPEAKGCYVYYDSFDNNCSVEIVTLDC